MVWCKCLWLWTYFAVHLIYSNLNTDQCTDYSRKHFSEKSIKSSTGLKSTIRKMQHRKCDTWLICVIDRWRTEMIRPDKNNQFIDVSTSAFQKNKVSVKSTPVWKCQTPPVIFLSYKPLCSDISDHLTTNQLKPASKSTSVFFRASHCQCTTRTSGRTGCCDTISQVEMNNFK